MLAKSIKRMVKIKAFQGYVPEQGLAQKLVSPPYDVLDSEEARQMADGNEFSFLHVNKPEIDLDPSIDVYSEVVYEKGKTNLLSFIEKGWLIQEPEPILYVYSVTMKGKTQYGVVAGSSIDDYEHDRIKKHELTRKKKEEDRTKLTDIQGANAGPVFLTYLASPRVDSIVQIVTSRAPWIDIETDDALRHTLWKMTVAESNETVEAFGEVSHTYIADGHHRAASAFNVGKLRKQRFSESGTAVTGEEDFNYFMSILYPHDQVGVYDYNRVVKDLNGKTPEEFLEELKDNFELFEIEHPRPTAKHHFSIYVGNKWTGIRIKEDKIVGDDPVNRLDSFLLTELCLKPILNIQDLTTDERIDFVGGSRGLEELERRCQRDCVGAIAMYPVSVEEVMAIADANQIMPPKSTWFEPKPRSGMIVKVFSA